MQRSARGRKKTLQKVLSLLLLHVTPLWTHNTVLKQPTSLDSCCFIHTEVPANLLLTCSLGWSQGLHWRPPVRLENCCGRNSQQREAFKGALSWFWRPDKTCGIKGGCFRSVIACRGTDSRAQLACSSRPCSMSPVGLAAVREPQSFCWHTHCSDREQHSLKSKPL